MDFIFRGKTECKALPRVLHGTGTPKQLEEVVLGALACKLHLCSHTMPGGRCTAARNGSQPFRQWFTAQGLHSCRNGHSIDTGTNLTPSSTSGRSCLLSHLEESTRFTQLDAVDAGIQLRRVRHKLSPDTCLLRMQQTILS